jgi:hypothetical protein
MASPTARTLMIRMARRIDSFSDSLAYSEALYQQA